MKLPYMDKLDKIRAASPKTPWSSLLPFGLPLGHSLRQQPKIYALVGESGTGKSFQAKLVAHKHHIGLIIDDGLLIKDERILAGRSAKDEQTFLGAIRAALFDSDELCTAVKERLKQEKFRKLLILGTSFRMVVKIAARLELPPIRKFLRIKDIASRKEIETALRLRKIEGKHVIPVPSIEIHRNYADIFLEAINVRKKNVLPGEIIIPKMHEHSLVRPAYSRRRRVKLSKEALSQMAQLSVDEYNAYVRKGAATTGNAFRVIKVEVMDKTEDGRVADGYRVAFTVDISGDTALGEEISGLQKFIISDIEHFTGILIEDVNIVIDKIV